MYKGLTIYMLTARYKSMLVIEAGPSSGLGLALRDSEEVGRS